MENTTKKPSLQQVNAIDCGLFAMTNCLHFFEVMIVDESIFLNRMFEPKSASLYRVQLLFPWFMWEEADEAMEVVLMSSSSHP